MPLKTLLILKIQIANFNLKANNNNKIKQEFPQNSFKSWNEVDDFLKEKLKQINSIFNEGQEIRLRNKKEIHTFEKELEEIENNLQRLKSRKKEIEHLLPKVKEFQKPFDIVENNQKILEEMCSNVSIFCKNEKEMNNELVKLYSEKSFEEFDCLDFSKLLWKMDLTKYQCILETSNIDGEFVSMMIDEPFVWDQLRVEKRDFYDVSF